MADCMKWRLVHDLKEMGVPVRAEVFGLFAACIPQHARGALEGMPLRKRQGIVPDMLCHLQWDDL